MKLQELIGPVNAVVERTKTALSYLQNVEGTLRYKRRYHELGTNPEDTLSSTVLRLTKSVKALNESKAMVQNILKTIQPDALPTHEQTGKTWEVIHHIENATKKDGLKDMTNEQLRTLVTEVYDKLVESTAE